jgi:unsaturated rhamnogalacturonyl hydrolase
MAQAPLHTPSTLNSWSVRMVDSTLKRYTLQDAVWHYEHALLVKAIVEAGTVTGEARYTRFGQDWVDHFIAEDGAIRTYRVDEFNLDQVNPGKLLFPLYKQTRKEHYLKALQLIQEQLERQPRNASGGFWHKQIYPHQMWLDGIYMAAPFLAEYAATFDLPAVFDDLTRQIMLIKDHTRDARTGLLYHAWDESRQQRWADPGTGHSPHFWGRAVGWYLMGIVDVLDFLPAAHPRSRDLIASLEETARALVQVQDKASGLWYQILDLPDRAGNYLEASASAMIIYAFAKGVREGHLPAEYQSAARRAYHGLLQNMVKVDAQGLLTLEGICGVAGLGGEPYRDGSFEYYIGEKIILNDPKGVGPFILAALEMEAAENKPGPGG